MWDVCHRLLILVLRSWVYQGTTRTWFREPGEPQNQEQHENPKNQEEKNSNHQSLIKTTIITSHV